MTAKELISDEIPTLDASDNALMAMQWMEEYKVKHLPVVRGSDLLGLISDTAVLDLPNPEDPLGDHPDKLQNLYIAETQHIYDVIGVFAEFQLSALPVVNEKLQYQGVICLYTLLREMSRIVSATEPGSIIVLELNQTDYSLSEIAQIVEGNDGRVISVYATPHEDSTKLEVTLKINRENVGGILQTFARYDYVVSASFRESTSNNDLQDRYEELMRFLKM